MKLQWNTYLYFFVGRLLLEPSASSSSSFMTSSFLIQMLKMDKRLFKNWVLHITWGIFFESWEIYLQFLPFPLIMSRASYCVCSSQNLLKVITSFWHTFLQWMNPMILGRHSGWLSKLMHSPLLLLPLQ